MDVRLAGRVHPGFIAAGLGILVFVAVAAANTIVGNSMYVVFLWLWSQLMASIFVNPWPWCVVFILVIGICSGVLVWWRTSRRLQLARRVKDFDSQLLRLLPNLIFSTDLHKGMKLLMYPLLEEALAIFDASVQRATLFLPDPSDEKCLIVWADSRKSEEGRQSTRFYIGKDAGLYPRRGVAGEVYLTGKPLVTHIFERKNPSTNGKRLTTDQPDIYVPFGEPKRMAYCSFVCVSVGVGEGPGDTLGILCLDSINLHTFDQTELQDDYLLPVASRIAAALSIYHQLSAIKCQAQLAKAPVEITSTQVVNGAP